MAQDDTARHKAAGSTPEPLRPLRFGPCELDLARYELRRDGAPVAIEPRGFDLLRLLVAHAGHTVTKDEIFRTIWGRRFVSDAALSSQIKAVRHALGDDGTRQHTIATVHGRGFRFLPAIDTSEPTESLVKNPAPLAEPARRMRPVVAILPFDAADGDDWLGDGLAEAVIAALTRHRWLAIVAGAQPRRCAPRLLIASRPSP